MTLAVRVINRADEPHLPTLADTLAPLLGVAGAGSFHLRWSNGQVVIEQASFAGVDTTAVDAAVAAAPSTSAELDAKTDIDRWPKALLAFARLVTIELNRLRQNPSTTFSAYTQAQVIQAIQNEVDNV